MKRQLHFIVRDKVTQRVSWIALTSLVLLSFYFISSAYFNALSQKESDHLNRLSAIVRTLAIQLEGDQLEQMLTDFSTQQEAVAHLKYHHIYHALRKVRQTNNLKAPIHILRPDPQTQQFMVFANSESLQSFGQAFDNVNEEFIETYTLGGQLSHHEGKKGEWLSAYAPIQNTQGEVIAAVRIDDYFENFYTGATQKMWQNILLSMVVVVLICLALLHFINRAIRIMREKEKAEQKAAIKAKFLSTMSHEIRTPMNAVIGLSNILLQENPRGDQLNNLNTLKFSADLLLSLINDILDYSKIEAGKISLEKIDFNLHQLIQNNRNALDIKAKEKGLNLLVNINPEVPTWVAGDQIRLSQILTNLVGNAIKFTMEGQVEIKLDPIPSNGSTVGVRFSVTDTGIGIPSNKFEQIFNSFSQAEANTTRRFGGTGLGLSITKKLLELQDSRIQLESEVGKGSCFFFDLYFSPAKTARSTAAPLALDPFDVAEDFDNARILLVEDNKINVMVAKKFLSRWNLKVDVAYNGQEAIDEIKARDYELVLMDLNMPVMDGYEATASIRAMDDPKYRALPIIALSASAISDYRSKAIEVGMDEFVTKPFNPRELYDVLYRFIKVPV